MDKEFTCVCGKLCIGAQKFNGHRAHCKQYLQSVGKYEAVKAANIRAGKTTSAIMKARYQDQLTQRKCQEAEHFLRLQKKCEHCGAVMTEKFGSGRFCSRSCANSRERTEEQKKKIGASVVTTYKSSGKEAQTIARKALEDAQSRKHYENNPMYCIVCGTKLPYEKRNSRSCSMECRNRYISDKTRHTKEHIGKHVVGRHIVYKVTCLLDSRYYIGVRKTELDFDGYLGSGVKITRMVKKYGKENFVRETLFEFDNSTDAFNKEKELLKEHLDNPLCVNIASGGQGGKTH